MSKRLAQFVLAGLLGFAPVSPVNAQSTAPIHSLAAALIDAGAAFGRGRSDDSLVVVDDSSFRALLPDSDVVAALQRPGSNLRIEGGTPAVICGDDRYSCRIPNGGSAIRLYTLQVLGDSAVAQVTVNSRVTLSDNRLDVTGELVQFTLRCVGGDWQLVETKRLLIS